VSAVILNFWSGRFGNRMYQYAYGVTYAKLRGVEFIVPSDWEGTKLFKNQHHTVIENEEFRKELNFPTLGEDGKPNPSRFDIVKKYIPNVKPIDPHSLWGYYYDGRPVTYDVICAYHYGNISKIPTIFIPQSRSHLLKVFEFSDEVKESESYKYWHSRKGTYDVAHLRRGDISRPGPYKVGVNHYPVMSLDSYYRAFEKFGYDKDKIEWISDDATNTWHKDRPVTENLGFKYPEGSIYKPGIIFDWLDDFLKMYFARTVFRGNSSFSWWVNFLSGVNAYAPIIDKRAPEGDVRPELDFDFVKGNYPHWMYTEPTPWEIIISH